MVDTAEDRRSPQVSMAFWSYLSWGLRRLRWVFCLFSNLTGKDQGNLIRGLSSFRVDNQRFFKASSIRHLTKHVISKPQQCGELFLLSAPDSPVS